MRTSHRPGSLRESFDHRLHPFSSIVIVEAGPLLRQESLGAVVQREMREADGAD